MKKELTYEAALAELEDIVGKVERGELAIDQLTSQLKHAHELLAFCKTQLTQVETDVNTLLNSNEAEK